MTTNHAMGKCTCMPFHNSYKIASSIIIIAHYTTLTLLLLLASLFIFFRNRLPGALAPTGFFDPLGFAQTGISLNEIKRYREAEAMHGRVAMVAAVGYLAGEAVSGPFHIVGPANDQLQQVPAPAFAFLTVAIAAAELNRARVGWVEPDLGSWTKTLWTLRENYYPGDVGFDPLGLKPTDPKTFANMQTRELQNGRLAMLGVAGMCAQELVNHRTILETFTFYQKVYSGVNPYELCGAADQIVC